MPNINGIDIPDQWHNTLVKFQEVDPLAMIAGGALRDLSLGRLPKDLDIFTRVLPLQDWETSDIDYEGMKYVEAVVTYASGLDIPVNVILHEPCSPQEMLESFDFGICQIGYNGKEMLFTPAYNWDMKYGVMTMRHTDRYPRSIKRYARWLDRYDWEMRIPQLDSKEAF